jgi:two-component system NarL family response regulator
LGKGVVADEFLTALRSVAAGKRYLPQEIAARLAERVLSRPLSARELQVLELVQKGQSNRQIAEGLDLAERTVAMYMGHILDKLGVRSRTEAVSVALERGILPSK